MAVRALRGLVVLVAALGFTAPAHALSVLDNDRVRVGVDLERGGKIAWLSEAQGEHADDLVFESEQLRPAS